MANSAKEARRDQICVAVDPELRAALARAAAEDHRTISGQVRHFVAKALAEQQDAGRAAA